LLDGMRIGVVVPARDEEELLGAVLEGMPAFVDRAIVVDDASTDRTAEVARSFSEHDHRITCTSHQRSRGVGGAILSGYEQLHAEGCEALVVMAGDDQMDPGDLPALLAPLCSGEADYVKGNRFAHPDLLRAMPTERLAGNLVLTWITRRVALYPELRDAQCGYTALRAAFVPGVLAARIYPGYGFPNALLARLGALGARLAQVPVRPIYGRAKSGLSIGRVLRTYPGVLWRAWRMRREGNRAAQRLSAAPEP
jgi:glycosyltransferase involved in cell wall biosynthesis